MLYRLELENFYSFREPQVIDLRIGDNVPDEPGRFDPIFPGSAERAARVVALFGPNASGKSTVLKALAFIGWFVQHSFQTQPQASLPCERFNDAAAKTAPIRLAVEFGAPLEPAADGQRGAVPQGTWRYELTIIELHGRTVVGSETLKQRADGKGKWTRVFERVGDKVQAGKMFGMTGYSMVVDKVRDNASLLSTLAQFEHKPALRFCALAARISTNIFIDRSNISDQDAFAYYVQNTGSIEALNSAITRIDLGIRSMKIMPQTLGHPVAVFQHSGLDGFMPWNLESHGTRNFVKFYPYLHMSLESGGIALIDEIDISIHPLVLPEIVHWFHELDRNPRRAQLWATCHAASLLEDLLKEEVFFCEKDAKGRTSVYGLQDIQNVRRTDNRYRKYLSGVYGAIPQIG